MKLSYQSYLLASAQTDTANQEQPGGVKSRALVEEQDAAYNEQERSSKIHEGKQDFIASIDLDVSDRNQIQLGSNILHTHTKMLNSELYAAFCGQSDE